MSDTLGTSENDSLSGTILSDNIFGLEGDDVLRGRAGDDSLDGGDGRDFLHGNAGDDTLNGGDGHDWMSGGIDDDFLFGGNGRDRLLGGQGDDVLNGNDGSDLLFGQGGDDTFVFEPSSGPKQTDRIGGFVRDGLVDGDKLDFSAHGITEESDALAIAAQSGDNVVFTFEDGDRVILIRFGDISGLEGNFLV